VIAQGDVWLLEEPQHTPRPCLVLTRPAAIPVLRLLTVAPLTRTGRGIPTEVPLGPADGVRFECVASFDNIATVAAAHLTQRLGQIDPARWHEVCDATRIALGC
jgi:mRNA interferase MazF